MVKLLGYEDTKKYILNSFASHKLHHGVIFSGIRGVGKFSFVIEILKEITNNFSDIKNNPDILLIQHNSASKGDILVDDIRKINPFINLSSSASNYKFIVIDSIDSLNKNSANALLKNLEEPPKNTFFFLIYHNEKPVLDTILSRCNLIKIDNLNYQDFYQILKHHAFGINDNEIKVLFEVSNGSPATAIDFYRNDLIKIYEDIVKIIAFRSVNLDLFKFIEDYVKNDPNLEKMDHILKLFFSRSAKIAALNKLEFEFFEDEFLIIKQYLEKNNPTSMFNKYDKICDLLRKNNSLNLDSKHSLINIFNIL